MLTAGSLSADQADDLSVGGKTIQGALGEDQLAVHRNLEPATARRDQLTVDRERALQLGRQTDGAGLVVSLSAVFDLDSHRRSYMFGRETHPTKAVGL